VPDNERLMPPELGRIGRRNGLIVLGVVVVIVGGLIAFAVLASRTDGVRSFADPAVTIGTSTGDVRPVDDGKVGLSYEFEYEGEQYLAVGTYPFDDSEDAGAAIARMGEESIRVQVVFDESDPSRSRADDHQLFTELR
jgi:hypothetical protein